MLFMGSRGTDFYSLFERNAALPGLPRHLSSSGQIGWGGARPAGSGTICRGLRGQARREHAPSTLPAKACSRVLAPRSPEP